MLHDGAMKAQTVYKSPVLPLTPPPQSEFGNCNLAKYRFFFLKSEHRTFLTDVTSPSNT